MNEILELNKELTVNRLPVLTWNHLKVNDSKIVVPADLDLQLESSEIRGVKYGINILENTAEFEPFPMGMGKEAFSYVTQNAKSNTTYVVEEKKSFHQPIVLQNTLKADWLDYTKIVAKKDSNATFILSYEAKKEAKGLHGNAIQMKLEEGAKVKLHIVQMLNTNYEHFTNIGISCENGAEVEVSYIGIGAKRFWVGCEVQLEGIESKCKLETSYLGGENREMDYNMIARHIGKKTESEIKSYGVLSKNSKKIMRGTIDFIKGAKGAVGSETENVLMLSKQAENKSVPLILCAEDDVSGRHGASVGNMNPQQLFYLTSRGVTKEEAHKMFALSMVERMKMSFEDERIRQRLEETGGEYLEQLI